MKYSQSVIILILVLLLSADVFAQRRMDYETLRQRDRTPNVFVEVNILPDSENTSEATLFTAFKIEYNHLRFQRVREADIDPQNSFRFFTDLSVSVDVMEISREDFQRQRNETRRTRRFSSPEPPQTSRVGSKYWNHRIHSTTYEQTQSRTEFVDGIISKEIAPGYYLLNISIESDGSTRGRMQRRIHVPDFSNNSKPIFYHLDETSLSKLPAVSPLVNVGGNVYYGKDFTSLILIPDFDENSSYSLRIRQANVSERDTTTANTMFEQVLGDDHIFKNLSAKPSADTSKAQLDISHAPDGRTFARILIPNQRFPNSHFMMSLLEESENGESKLIGSTIFQNRWFDMPVSLLNVDVAINMLRFILDDQQLSSMRRGTEQEKEKRFREFWDKRNPTPETEYNELMVEYYRRIDYAYENFTSPTMPGYMSDQGRVYIQNGPPSRIERRFPGQQQTVEVWMYGERQFIFRATTGFGDYELIDRR